MSKAKRIAILVLVPLVLLGVAVGIQGLRYAWYHNYSQGSRTGIVRKISVKGSPLCKYLSGELLLINNGGGHATQETWEFTVEDDSQQNPVVQKLHEAEKSAKTVTLDYRQHFQNKGKFPFRYVCWDTDYYITGVE